MAGTERARYDERAYGEGEACPWCGAPDCDGECEPCDHSCEDGCWEYGDGYCHHEHYCHCGRCGCPGYCDDYQTYNLRPAETGGTENPGD